MVSVSHNKHTLLGCNFYICKKIDNLKFNFYILTEEFIQGPNGVVAAESCISIIIV